MPSDRILPDLPCMCEWKSIPRSVGVSDVRGDLEPRSSPFAQTAVIRQVEEARIAGHLRNWRDLSVPWGPIEVLLSPLSGSGECSSQAEASEISCFHQMPSDSTVRSTPFALSRYKVEPSTAGQPRGRPPGPHPATDPPSRRTDPRPPGRRRHHCDPAAPNRIQPPSRALVVPLAASAGLGGKSS